MDENIIAPFPMYADEYIVWMEPKYGFFKKGQGKILLVVTLALMLISIVLTMLAIAYDGEYIVLNLGAFFGFLSSFSFIITGLVMLSMHRRYKCFTYYISNFRLIRFNSKAKELKFGYLFNVNEIILHKDSKDGNYLEILWNADEDDPNLFHVFSNINRCNEAHRTITEQKKSLNQKPVSFSTITQ